MPRNNDSAGKMSAGAGGGSSNSDRFQPGRVMLVLRDALVDDELVYQIALQAGEVKNVHRPQHNRQLVFVQYEDPIVAEHAIAMMKKLPIFKGVDPAIKSERFVKDKSDVGGGSGGNSNNNNYNDDQQQRSSSNMNNQMNKGGGNRQQKPGNNANNNKNINNRINNNNNSGMNGYGDVNLMTMDFETSQRPQSRTTDMYQPKFNLGCWSCTKMPYFECRCGAFYCNVECQRADWPIHKDVCMPRLVPISSSSNRILQEALSASLQRSGVDSQSHYQQQQQQQQYQQQERQPQQNQQQKQQKQSQQQQNQNNRRGQTNNNSNNKDFQSPVDQQQNQGKPKKDSPRTPGQEPEAQRQPPKQQKQPTTPKSSPEEQNSVGGSAEKVSRLGNKLQRLKIAKSGGGVTRGILQAGPFPREGAAVKITASLPSGVLYIYHNNGKDGQQSEYYLLTNRMFKAANDAGALKAVPTVDDVIFAPFLGGYYRAKVLAVNVEKLQVFYVDFGNTDTVEWKQSREIADEDLKWARYLTYPVKLEGVESFSGEMLKLLETLEHVEEFEMVRADSMPGSEMKSVILKRPKQSLTLNMELMEVKERELRERKEREQKSKQQQQQSSSAEQSSSSSAQKAKVADVKIADPSNYEPVLFDESMETSPLPFGSTKKLIIIDASEVMETRIISVVAAENVEKYAAVLEHCGLAGAKDSNVYKPIEEGEVCLVLHQEDWSRALYDISDGSYMLLDVGIIATVPAGNVRRFPPKLSHMVYNNEVVVENLPKLKAMMKDGKSDTVHGAIIEAKVSASEEGTSITIVDALVSP
nr:uncharacterized protein LOC109425508 isoform X3 [Aedes albopictus]